MRCLFVVGVFVALAACSDDESAPLPVATKTADYVTIDADAVCRIFTTDCPRKTGETFEQCQTIYRATRVAPSCRAFLDGLTCATTQSELEEACWPKCTGAGSECDGPHIVQCTTSGREYTYDCAGVCATQGKAWSRDCGTSYKGQRSERATCWCN